MPRCRARCPRCSPAAESPTRWAGAGVPSGRGRGPKRPGPGWGLLDVLAAMTAPVGERPTVTAALVAAADLFDPSCRPWPAGLTPEAIHTTAVIPPSMNSTCPLT